MQLLITLKYERVGKIFNDDENQIFFSQIKFFNI